MPVRTFSFVEGELIHQYDGTNSHDILPDPLGNVVGLLGASSGIEFDFEYWPYEEVPSAFSAVTPYRYIGAQGYYSDIYSRVYVVARHYRAPYGRWMTVDPIWPRESAYAYVGGGPVSSSDPTGMWRWTTYGLSQTQRQDVWDAIPWADDPGLISFIECLEDPVHCPKNFLQGDTKAGNIGKIIRDWKNSTTTIGFTIRLDRDDSEDCKKKGSRPARCAWVDTGQSRPRTIHLCVPRVWTDSMCKPLRCVLMHELIHAAGLNHHENEAAFQCVYKITECATFQAIDTV